MPELPVSKLPDISSRQWLFLFILFAAGLVSPNFFKSLVLAGDLFPLKIDMESFLGISEEHPDLKKAALMDIVTFLILAFLAGQSEDLFWAATVAGQILPIPQQLGDMFSPNVLFASGFGYPRIFY